VGFYNPRNENSSGSDVAQYYYRTSGAGAGRADLNDPQDASAHGPLEGLFLFLHDPEKREPVFGSGHAEIEKLEGRETSKA
jgi:hypothetical protein